MKRFRLDEDSLGQVKVPSDAYYGPFTVRALRVYRVTGCRAHPKLLEAYVLIKSAAARANGTLKQLGSRKASAIVKACDEILCGAFQDQFVVDAINSGAGTALHMNVNEVICNRALELMGRKKGEYQHLHPNDDVNMSQSSNDTFPTALHVAILFDLNELEPALKMLISSLRGASRKFQGAAKLGRTHLMDALPVTLGMELSAYAMAIERAAGAIRASRKGLEDVPLGGTAVGTGANAPKGYRRLAVKTLALASSLRLKPMSLPAYGLQSRFAVASTSSALRNLALELIRIANDIRLMASGPFGGFAELTLPAVHAGSSMMPGKVNPSVAEALDMACFCVVGNDVSVALQAQAGQLELNVMLPAMAKCALESIDLLKSTVPVFAAELIDGLTADRKRMSSLVEKSPALVTLLAPKIGYMKAAELLKKSVSR